jgi:hypothetical protein
MRRRMFLVVLTIALVLVMVLPSMAAAQGPRRGPSHVRGPSVVVRGYFGYPYYSPLWGFYPGYPYGYWGWESQWGYRGAYYRGGWLRLQVTPKQTQVYVDGYYVGIVDDFDGIFQSLDLPPGGHELVLYLEGFRTVRQSFYVTVGRTFKVSYAMARLGPGETSEPPPQPPAGPPDEEIQPPVREPAPVPQAAEPPQPRQPRQPRPAPVEPAQRDVRAFGTLSIRVQPADAEVLIDGENWRGPEAQERLLVNVAEGSHHVEIRKAGFVTYSTDIQIRSGETATLNVSLPPRDPQGESR